MTIRQWILDRLTPHQCTKFGCGYQPQGHNPHHEGCFEFSSDDFVTATQMVKTDNALPPD